MDTLDSKKKRVKGTKCPDCGSRCRRAIFNDISPLEYETFMQCMNICCSATFRILTTITHRMSPGKLPLSEQVVLPYSPAVIIRRNKAAKDTERKVEKIEH